MYKCVPRVFLDIIHWLLRLKIVNTLFAYFFMHSSVHIEGLSDSCVSPDLHSYFTGSLTLMLLAANLAITI